MTLNGDDEAARRVDARNDVTSDQSAGTRAGGDVVIKGPDQAPPDETQSGGTRAGGDVVIKGPSQ